MIDFWERRADVLVCTTIIEAGLMISSANTLLIERADMLGLSQLHQLRGRGGPRAERGYAYFLYPPEKPLTEAAQTGFRPSRRTATSARDGSGDEGSREVRGAGKPARRRAVRAHRRRRLRPLHPACRRGGRGVSRTGRRAGTRGPDRGAGRGPPCRPTMSNRSGCGSRCTNGIASACRGGRQSARG